MWTVTDAMWQLKELRQQQGLTVQDVASHIKRELGIDVSPKTIYG